MQHSLFAPTDSESLSQSFSISCLSIYVIYRSRIWSYFDDNFHYHYFGKSYPMKRRCIHIRIYFEKKCFGELNDRGKIRMERNGFLQKTYSYVCKKFSIISDQNWCKVSIWHLNVLCVSFFIRHLRIEGYSRKVKPLYTTLWMKHVKVNKMLDEKNNFIRPSHYWQLP